MTAKRVPPAQLATPLRDAITRLNRRVRQARPVGDLTVTQLSALTSLQLAGALTPRELADVGAGPAADDDQDRRRSWRSAAWCARTPHPTDGRQVILARDRGGPGRARPVRAGARRVAGPPAGRARPRTNATRCCGPRRSFSRSPAPEPRHAPVRCRPPCDDAYDRLRRRSTRAGEAEHDIPVPAGPQLPALRHRPAGQADRRLDDVHRAGLARPRPLRQLGRPRSAWSPRCSSPRCCCSPCRRQARRPVRQAAAALRRQRASGPSWRSVMGVLVAHRRGRSSGTSSSSPRLLGVANAIETPVRQAFVSELVGMPLLPNALPLSAATFNTARIVGPALAGVGHRRSSTSGRSS